MSLRKQKGFKSLQLLYGNFSLSQYDYLRKNLSEKSAKLEIWSTGCPIINKLKIVFRNAYIMF